MTSLLYDADCAVCIWIAALVLRVDRRCRLEPVPIRSRRGRVLLSGLDRERRLVSWHLVRADGRRRSGGRAVLALAAQFAPAWLGPPGRLVARLLALPLALLYAPLAARRAALSPLVPASSKRRAARLVTARSRGRGLSRPLGRRRCA
jgi:predicted DCC family thiol-disulfide oxidoreductase YuxK